MLAAGLAVYWLLSTTVLSDNLGSQIRFVNDDFDRVIYSQRGAWALHGLVPYRGAFSEYPNVATYLFGLPYFITGGDFFAYRAIFSFVMCVCLGLMVGLLQRFLPGRESLAYLMLLPAPLYFTINRFDLLASLFVVLSLWYLQQHRAALSGICLGVAALTKWYPVLLLPLFLSHAYRRDRRSSQTLLIAFGAACVAIIAPTVIGVGLRPMLRPYAFHASRGLEMVSLPALLHWYGVQWLGVTVPPRLVELGCLSGVLLAVVASLRARVDSIERVACWSVVILSASILLSTVWSPQWMLWVLPLMIVIARRATDVPWLVAYGVFGYLVFPLIHDGLHGLQSTPVRLGSLAIYVILMRAIVVAHRQAVGVTAVTAVAPKPAST